MTHASLFSGIGGFDLAAEWMGWENLFHCEWNPFGQKVLKHHFPNSISYNDITKTDFSIHRGQVDILTGGFPCQPYSSAGKRLGKEDERHLWPEMLRTIQEVQPSWVVGENVLGLTNWNGGLVFEEVQTDLEAKGYEVQAYVLPACAKNAPHRRDRVWFVAYSNLYDDNRKVRRINGEKKRISKKHRQEYSTTRKFRGTDIQDATDSNGNGFNECNSKYEISTSNERINAFCDIDKSNGNGFASNSNCIRQECRKEGRCTKRRSQPINEQFKGCNKLHRGNFEMFPSKSPICGGDDGIPRELDNITFSKWRQESIKSYGNAIVPQVALEIFKAIEKFELLKD
jgi:DNA (cytosine-5)-methyltransferase 1